MNLILNRLILKHHHPVGLCVMSNRFTLGNLLGCCECNIDFTAIKVGQFATSESSLSLASLLIFVWLNRLLGINGVIIPLGNPQYSMAFLQNAASFDRTVRIVSLLPTYSYFLHLTCILATEYPFLCFPLQFFVFEWKHHKAPYTHSSLFILLRYMQQFLNIRFYFIKDSNRMV